jgi:hypothetical protein
MQFNYMRERVKGAHFADHDDTVRDEGLDIGHHILVSEDSKQLVLPPQLQNLTIVLLQKWYLLHVKSFVVNFSLNSAMLTIIRFVDIWGQILRVEGLVKVSLLQVKAGFEKASNLDRNWLRCSEKD